MAVYDISSRQLITEQGSEEGALAKLRELIRTGVITFPYQRYFRRPPAELFANLCRSEIIPRYSIYRLRSYYPPQGFYLPPKFRGRPTIICSSHTYESIDVLSDHYIEAVRMTAKRYDQEQAIAECWSQPDTLRRVLTKERITPRSLRDAIYETIPEARIFNPTWARALLQLVMGQELKGKRWLDISAGWGDRLLAAMSLEMDYTGYDPNLALQPGHSAMIADFASTDRTYQIFYQPFETAALTGMYDVVMTSPPYFVLEEYAKDQVGQSIVSYPRLNDWLVSFLFRSLRSAWDHLLEGGYLILHLGDTHSINLAEATNLFIESELEGASWEGVIGIQNENGYPRPVWVWQKTTPRLAQRWQPSSWHRQELEPRSLIRCYPKLYREIIAQRAEAIIPSLQRQRHLNNELRSRVQQQMPHLPTLNSLLADDLLIANLLDRLGMEEAVRWYCHQFQYTYFR